MVAGGEAAEQAGSSSRAGEVRAALLYADPLTTALGRPNREQVNTVRPTAATTLQMLELTNGATLAERLTKGGEEAGGGEDL